MLLYRDIQGPLSVLARATMVKGVESICETWVSIMEQHSPSTRVLVDHERYEDETFVAINGPEVVHCDPLVKESMEEYWRQFLRAGDRGGHFVRRRNDVKNWTVSKAVDALAKEPPRLSFMAK